MNKIGLVTGAASGLGYEFSNLLAGDSYDLILIDINESQLLLAKQRIEEKYKIQVNTLTCDLRKPRIAQYVYEQVKEKNIDVLINNAGFGLFGLFTDTDWEIEESMIYLHILTMTHLTKLILKDMISKREGRILNISSMAAFQPGPLMAVYFATKAYILSFSEALANEVRGTGVSVTALCPGQTKTNFENIAAINSKSTVSKIKYFTADPAKVALCGYKAMKAGRMTAVPGTMNKFILLLSTLIPRTISGILIKRIQVKIRK